MGWPTRKYLSQRLLHAKITGIGTHATAKAMYGKHYYLSGMQFISAGN